MEDQENLTTTEEKRKGENFAPCPPFLRGGESFRRRGPTHYTEVKTALAGNHPFGAVLVLDGKIVLKDRNTVATDRDPTAHAETNLVAAAIQELAPDQLGRSVL